MSVSGILLQISAAMELKITEISTISTGYQSRKSIENEEAGSHFLLQIRDFNPDRTQIKSDGMIRFTPNLSSRVEQLQLDDVVFLSRGQKNFAFAVPELPSPTFAGSYFFVLRPKPIITGPYLAWYLNQPAAQHHFKRLATTGAHMPVVTRDVIESLKVPVPDLPTQQKIVDLDALALTQSHLLAELAKKKRALVNAACRQAISK